MLSVARRPRTTIGKPTGGRCTSRSAAAAASTTAKAQPLQLGTKRPQKTQTLLAVARRCRDCGLSLGALEGALHRCADALVWSFGGEALAIPTEGRGPAVDCRIVKLGAPASTPGSAAGEAFGTLWDFVRTDMSHGFEQPSTAAGTAAAVLLALRGRQVLGLLWVERITNAEILHIAEEDAIGAPAASSAIATAGAGSLVSKASDVLSAAGDVTVNDSPKAMASPVAVRATLGVALVWVRRTERRKGLATAMLDAARGCMAGLGSPPIPLTEVAFSQTTDMGSRLAKSYIGASHSGGVLMYSPSCV